MPNIFKSMFNNTTNASARASSSANPEINNPEELKQKVCSEMTIAAARLAKKSRLSYCIKPELLQLVVGGYINANPQHNNPSNVTALETSNQWRINYYNLCYGLEKTEGSRTPAGYTCYMQGLFGFIDQLQNIHLLVGEKFDQGRDSNFPNYSKIGSFAYVSELERMDLVDGICLVDGKVQEGKYAYVSDLKSVCLVDGKVTFANKEVQEGKWSYVREMKNICLVHGKANFVGGEVHDGKWGYISELKHMYLVDGTVTLPEVGVQKGTFSFSSEWKAVGLTNGVFSLQNGDVQTGDFKPNGARQQDVQLVNGKWKYADTGRTDEGDFAFIPELGAVKLTKGKTFDQEGRLLKDGERKYIRQLNGMVLMQGVSIAPDGSKQIGQRAYIPELNGVFLVDGSIHSANGYVQQGKWTYSPAQKRMVFQEPAPQAARPEGPRRPISTLNQETIQSIQQPVEFLKSVFDRFDHEKKQQAGLNALSRAAESVIYAQTHGAFTQSLSNFVAHLKYVSKQLFLYTHPDRVGNIEGGVEATRQLSELRENLDGNHRLWLNRWNSA